MDEARNLELTLIFIVIGLVMNLLAAAIVLFVLYYRQRMLSVESEKQREQTQHQEDLLRATLQSQESERIRIARDLHDEVGAMLSTIRLGVSMGEKTEQNAHVKSLIDESIESVRRISRDLLPRTLAEMGLSAALKELSTNLQKGSELKVHLTTVNHPRMAQERELAIYRMVQEFVNNSIKHAEASSITIDMKMNGRTLVLTLSDDGQGFAMNTAGPGLGLKNLQSRANFIDADWQLTSKPGHGTLATLTVPLDQNTRKKHD